MTQERAWLSRGEGVAKLRDRIAEALAALAAAREEGRRAAFKEAFRIVEEHDAVIALRTLRALADKEPT